MFGRGKWWDKASPNRRIAFASIMLVVGVGLFVNAIRTDDVTWMIAPLVIGFFLATQIVRAINEKKRGGPS